MSGFLQCCTLLENFTDDAIGKLYVTKFLTFSLYLTKLNVTERFAIASSVTYSEIRQNFSNSVRVCRVFLAPIVYPASAPSKREPWFWMRRCTIFLGQCEYNEYIARRTWQSMYCIKKIVASYYCKLYRKYFYHSIVICCTCTFCSTASPSSKKYACNVYLPGRLKKNQYYNPDFPNLRKNFILYVRILCYS